MRRCNLATRSILALFIALTVSLAAPSAHAQLICGDCDLSTTLTILDALVAAQHSAGIVTLMGDQFVACDVDLSITVSVLDALLIAQAAAGLTVVLDCNQAPACAVSLPTGGAFLAEVGIEFDALDPDTDPLDLVIEWSSDGGASFALCTASAASALANPATGIAPSVGLAFEWDALVDVAPAMRPLAVLVRVRVDDGVLSANCASSSFDLIVSMVCASPDTWTQLTPSGAAPGMRYYSTGAWDSTRSRMVVHGGTGTELWFYDPATNTWSAGAAAPGGASTHHTIVYDERDDCIFNWNGDAGMLYRCDFGVSSLGVWSALTPGGAWPSAHWGTGVYDAANQRLIWAGSQSVADGLWELPIAPGGVPGSWNPLSISGSTYGARWGWRADYDPVGQRIVLFSGNPSVATDRIVAIAIPVAGPYTVTITNPPSNPHSFWYTQVFFDGPANALYVWSGTYSSSTCDYLTRVDLGAPAPIYEPRTMGATNPAQRYAAALAHDRATRTVYIFAGREDAGGSTWSDLWRLCY